MTEKPHTETDVSKNLTAVLKDLRPIMRKAMDLSAQDVAAIIVEPILQALGWETRDPKHARRSDRHAGLRLLSSGKTALTIRTHSGFEDVPVVLADLAEQSGEWIIATNGSEWRIFNRHNTSQPFRSVSLADAQSARDSLQVLLNLRRDVFHQDSLTEAWMSEAVDKDITRILARHLDGSQDLIAALSRELKALGMTISPDEVRAALSRIDISLGEKGLDQALTPQPDSGPPDQSSRADTPKKSAQEKKPAKAKKTPATKPEGKPAAKISKSKTTPAPDVPQSTDRESDPYQDAVIAASRPADLPGSPEAIGWPKSATHAMQRRNNIVFMKHDQASGSSTLLSGSLIAAGMGKALGNPLVVARRNAIETGLIAPYGGGMMQVKRSIKFDSPKNAASFAAGTLVKDLNVWKTETGEILGETVLLPENPTSVPEPEGLENTAEA